LLSGNSSLSKAAEWTVGSFGLTGIIRRDRIALEGEWKAVRLYRSATELQKLDEGDTLIGEGALAGFALPVAEIFAE
jgi:hypothetical protein